MSCNFNTQTLINTYLFMSRMETKYKTKKWLAATYAVVLTFVILFLLFLYMEGGINPYMHIINSYYGILIVLLIYLYFKIGLWSAVPLYIVALASLARGVYKYNNFYETFIQNGALQTISLYIASLIVINIYLIYHTPQIRITNNQLVLSHGRTTIDWNNITEIELIGENLRVTKDAFTLSPLYEGIGFIENQSDLIKALSRHCHKRDIPFKIVNNASRLYQNLLFGVILTAFMLEFFSYSSLIL